MKTSLVRMGLLVVLLFTLLTACVSVPPTGNQMGAQALTGDLSGSIRIEDDLTVGGTITLEGATADAYQTLLTPTDATADRTITIPNVTGTVMLTANPGIMVIGVNTVTSTLTLSHGLTTPQAVFCTLLQDAEANNATCSATISGSTVVLKAWKADGVTAGSVGKLMSWMVTGQP